jgi:solute carrier family 50 protein (sugar transporter)
MNPMFAVMMIPNSMINLAYGFLLADPWIAAPNVTGLCIGIYYSLILFRALPFSRFRMYSLLMPGLLFITVFISCLTLIYFNPRDPSTARLIQGIAATVCIVAFYASPLSSMFTVIKTKDSSSIHLPLSLVMLLNSLFWGAYGVFLANPFVYGPNILGALSSIAQIILGLVFPRTKAGGKSWLTINGNRWWRSPGAQIDMAELESGVVTVLVGEDGKPETDDKDTASEKTETVSQRVDTPSPRTNGSEDA